MRIYEYIEHIELYVSRELCSLRHSGDIIMQDIFDTDDEHVTSWELSSDEKPELDALALAEYIGQARSRSLSVF